MAGKTIPEALFEAGSRFLSRAAHAVLENPRGQETLARAVGIAQRGRQRLEAAQERVLAAAGIPGRKDYEDLARQLARIKRKTRELSERLEGIAPQDEVEDEER
jgi:hypothetical protein